METTTIQPERAEKPRARSRHLAPLFVLLVLAPAVAELLLGDMTFDASFPFLFLLNLSYYGTGAIIIREIVRRRGLHWAWIPILAFAYGLIEEGLVLHTLFNPNFPGIGSQGYYGRAFGVDWVWSAFVLGLHTVWSISVPVLVTELIFPRYRHERWIGNVGLPIICVIFVLAMTFIAFFVTPYMAPGFVAPLPALIVTALLAACILSLALFLPVRRSTVTLTETRSAPNPWLVGVSAFVLAGLFLVFHRAFDLMPGLPALVAVLLYLVMDTIAIFALWRWTVPGGGWNDTHWVALAFAALLGYCFIGFLVTKEDIVNQAFHGAVVVLTVALMALLTIRVRRRVANISSHHQYSDSLIAKGE